MSTKGTVPANDSENWATGDGASRGVGRAIVERLERTGATVVAHYNQGRSGAEEATASYPVHRVHLVGADLSMPSGGADLWDGAVEAAGRIDSVVLNAGIMPKVELDADADEWRTTFATTLQVNTLSVADFTRHAVGHFQIHGGGIIVGISSWVAHRGAGHPNLAVYAASKSATAALLKTVARAYAADDILTYLVAPGAVDTKMTVSSSRDRGGLDEIKKTLSMGELVPPAELAGLVSVLCSGTLRARLSTSTARRTYAEKCCPRPLMRDTMLAQRPTVAWRRT